MTFLSDSSRKGFDRCSCGAILSDVADPGLLSFPDAPSLACWCCSELGLLGVGGSRHDVDPRRGVLVAHTVQVGRESGEICLLPFLVPPTWSRVVWDTCQIVRIGPSLTYVDPWRELEPLEHSLEGRRIHIERVSSPRAPLVRERLRDTDLVVGVDESSVDVIARLPVPDDADVAILAADIPWRALYGRAFAPLDSWSPDSTGVQSCLRLAGLMGYVLELGADPARDGLSPLEHLMSKFEAPDLVPHTHPHEEMSHARA